MTTDDQLLTTSQVAAQLGCTDRWVRELVKTGELPALRAASRPRSRLRIPAAAVDAFLRPALDQRLERAAELGVEEVS
jgi:excisionase family DNA binding protein